MFADWDDIFMTFFLFPPGVWVAGTDFVFKLPDFPGPDIRSHFCN